MFSHSKLYQLLRPILMFALLAMALLSFSRLALSLWQFERIVDFDMLVTVMLHGLRIDLSSVAYLLIIPSLLHPFLARSRFSSQWLRLLQLWFLAAFSLLLFFELSTPAFINEYDLRPNRLFIEYLDYPKEVASMLLTGHLFEIIASTAGVIFGTWLSWKAIQRFIVVNTERVSASIPVSFVALFFLIITVFLSARGTLGHRPINPALVYFSTDSLINSLTLNSAYGVAFAASQMKGEIQASKVYGNMPDDKVLQIVRETSELTADAYVNKEIPTLAVREPFYKGKPKNLVLVLEESVGAQFVSSLGGIDLMPELDKMMKTGWAFDQLYATGTRSVRGIEAVITGFTPTPARSVVKLDKSQQGFFTIAALLAKYDYTTQFIYGGESHFDNMKSFFLGNGFNNIVDFEDIESPEHVASWGASDEDLFRQANTELNKLHNSGKPFFSFIFSSSNHDPFDIPEGKITPLDYTEAEKEAYGSRELARHKAIQYADFALGKFIATAKTQDYWEDTIFIVVADHDARVYGSDLVPIKNFHIPGVILNSGFHNKRDPRVVSQIDLAPTLLSLMGLDEPTPMLGFDLTKTYTKERAMMQFADNYAYMSDSMVAILQPRKPITYYRYDHETLRLQDSEENPKLGDTALAHALFGSLAYGKGLYRLND